MERATTSCMARPYPDSNGAPGRKVKTPRRLARQGSPEGLAAPPERLAIRCLFAGPAASTAGYSYGETLEVSNETLGVSCGFFSVGRRR